MAEQQKPMSYPLSCVVCESDIILCVREDGEALSFGCRRCNRSWLPDPPVTLTVNPLFWKVKGV